MPDDEPAGVAGAEDVDSEGARVTPSPAGANPSPRMIVGLVLFMVVLAAFLAWMLTIGGETDAQRNLRELDARASPAPQGDPPMPASAGRVIYDAQCIACHGRGAVGGPGGPALVAKRYTPPRWEDQDLANVIYGGRGSMPAFSDRLSLEELAAVVAYIRWEQGLPVPGTQVRESPA
ncbi:MAG: hypothetical protein DCC49_01870 [Acidobacteria bacterium]|nr:MAG: hypothetical protein DCC49_01870 [Acidobacteriota bacterium]